MEYWVGKKVDGGLEKVPHFQLVIKYLEQNI